MEHHQFDNNEWIQCKGCQRLYDTPCIFHRHVCQLQDQNTQESSSSTSLSDTTTGICLLCQKLESTSWHQFGVKTFVDFLVK